VIVSLGNAQIAEPILQAVAARVADHIRRQANLFSADAGDERDVQYWTDYVVRRIAAREAVSEVSVDGVLLDQVQHESVSELGPHLVALEAWNRLGFDDCLAHLRFSELQRKDEELKRCSKLYGCYVLRTDNQTLNKV